MSGSNAASNSQMNYNTMQDQTDAASVASYSSSSALLKSKDKDAKDKTSIDVKKLQEQALRGQIKFNMAASVSETTA